MKFAIEHLVPALKKCAPNSQILSLEDQLRPYETDGLTAYRQMPEVVVLPADVEEVASLLRWCWNNKVPVVARGAGTGLSGGATPHPEGVLLSLARLQSIIEIDPANRTAVIQPGVTNLSVTEAASPFGLYYAPDPSSQIACTVGGNIAENAGGIHCLKYGLTVNNVLGLKWLTAAGELIELGGKVLDSPGYDLLALLHGSEGMLGIVVEATLRLLPKPESRVVLLAGFDSVSKAADAVSGLLTEGCLPAGLEMMDRLAIEAAEAFTHAGYPICEAILICELDGPLDALNEEAELVKQTFEQHHASHISLARDPKECERLWQGRKAAFPALGRISPDYYCMDGTIPRHKLAEVLAGIEELSERYQLKVANVFHAGDGNLHPLILYDANDPEQWAKTEAMGKAILSLCIEAGGVVSGEHGVGIEKLDSMCELFGSLELECFHAIKAAFDPAGILNPGKGIPTLTRCSELKGMHVHQGKIPFEHLPRY